MDLISGLTTPTIDTSMGIEIIFKLLYFVILTGYVLYAFLLSLRVRILSDTVVLGPNKLVAGVVYAHLIVAIVGSFLAFLIALLA